MEESGSTSLARPPPRTGCFAFEKLAKDPAYIADYEKVVKAKPRFILGADGERIIAELGNVQPSFVSFLRKFIASTN